MKLAIVVGHNRKAKGVVAKSPFNLQEFDFNRDLAGVMVNFAKYYGIQAKVFYRVPRGSYTKEIKEVYGKVDEWGADASIELHFNAGNGRTRGTLMLSGPSAQSLKMAHDVQDMVCALYNRTGKQDLGVTKYRNVKRGRASLITGKAPAILTEPFFGDVKAECRMVDKVGLDALANAYLAGISQAFDTKPTRVSKPKASLFARILKMFSGWLTRG